MADEVPKIVFEYEALPVEQPSIRLLTLFAGCNGNPIIGSLTAHMWNPETGIVEPNQDCI